MSGDCAWDCFCPKCTNICLGSICDTEEEMYKEQEEYEGKVIHCSSCGTYFDFNSHTILEKHELSKRIIVEDG